jgi:hypothetical protein
MPQIYDMVPPALLPLRRKACWGFFALKNPTASARDPSSERWNLMGEKE